MQISPNSFVPSFPEAILKTASTVQFAGKSVRSQGIFLADAS